MPFTCAKDLLETQEHKYSPSQRTEVGSSKSEERIRNVVSAFKLLEVGLFKMAVVSVYYYPNIVTEVEAGTVH